MPDSNGRNWWIRWLVGSLWGVLVLAMITIGNNVIANDKEARARDDKIKEVVEVKLEKIQVEQKLMRKEANEKFTQILVKLAEIKKDD